MLTVKYPIQSALIIISGQCRNHCFFGSFRLCFSLLYFALLVNLGPSSKMISTITISCISYATYWLTCSWIEIDELESSMFKRMQLEMHIQISQPKTFQVPYFSNYTLQPYRLCDIANILYVIYMYICIISYLAYLYM